MEELTPVETYELPIVIEQALALLDDRLAV